MTDSQTIDLPPEITDQGQYMTILPHFLPIPVSLIETNEIILPRHHRPGTDLLSKLVLKDKRTIEIIITAILGTDTISRIYFFWYLLKGSLLF